MSAPTRRATSRLLLPQRLPHSARTFTTSRSRSEDEQWPQRTPLGDFYKALLRDPLPYPYAHKPEEPPSTASPSVQPAHKKPKTTKETDSSPKDDKVAAISGDSSAATAPTFPSVREPTPQEKARIIFGSSLLGPAERASKLALKQAKSTYKAGVLIPPRPEEPDNCCMSGCVNCVWDRYREDMEEWSAAKNEAQARLQASEGSIDSDGGGSETNWKVPAGSDKIAKNMWDDEVYQGVPVGIKEFMKQEKRLKEKHVRDGTAGG